MTRKSPRANGPPAQANPTGQALWWIGLALLGLGAVMVHSTVWPPDSSGPWYRRVEMRHAIFAAAAALVLCGGWWIDYRRLIWPGRAAGEPARRGFPVVPALGLAATVVSALLVFVPGIGHAAGGKARWIRLGPSEYQIGFQPSELVKLALVVFLAAWLSRPEVQRRSLLKTFVPAVAIIGICTAVVITQDFGAAVLLAGSGVGVLALAGVPWYSLFALAGAGSAGGVAFVLHSPFRLARITALLNPWSTANPSAYQPRQSLLCILTGGYTGRGLGEGVLKRGFLPEAQTDFIFSALTEECGLIGAALLIGLLLGWLWQAQKAALRAEDPFGRLLCGGLGLMIGLQAVLHIAVDAVVAPPTGIGLPLVSAGGTALLTTAAAMALMISVTARRSD